MNRSGRDQPQPFAQGPPRDEQQRGRPQPARQAEPDADTGHAERKGEHYAHANAHDPIADQREDHRHAGILHAAQHARTHRLGGVDQLEQGCYSQEADRQRGRARIGGIGKVEEGFALGRFGRLARDIHSGRADTRSLKPVIDRSFGPLFRPKGTALPKQSKPENLAFQSTINDLGPKVFEYDAFKPIREDGLIGPRTESAFNAILPATGPDRFTSRLGHNLGFFDDDYDLT